MKNKPRSDNYSTVRTRSDSGVRREKGRFLYVRDKTTAVKDKHSYSTSTKSFSVDLLGSLIAILIACCVIRMLADNGANVTFYGFLNMLSNCPTVDLSVVKPWFGDLQFTGFWSLFEPIAEFLQTSLQLVCYFGVSLWNALMYALYFVGFLFGY